MTLFAYNVTESTVTLAAGKPTPVLPPSATPPARGPGVDVTSELKGLTDAEYAILEIQRQSVAKFSTHTIQYEWSGDAEFSLGTLVSGAISIHVPSSHASTHATGGGDPLTVESTVSAESGGVAAVNQNATATNQAAPAVVSVDPTTATTQASVIAGHEFFFAPEAMGTVKGSIVETATTASPSTQPSHPTTLSIVFSAGWSGGDIRINGVGADGQSISETVTAYPGSTVGTSNHFLTIDTNGITNLAPAGSGTDTADVAVGNRLGVALPRTGEYSITFTKLSVNGVDQAFFGLSSTYRNFAGATSPKNGANNFEVWYTGTYTPTQASHSHAVTDGGHTHMQNVHNHTQDAHTHTHNAHTHNTRDI